MKHKRQRRFPPMKQRPWLHVLGWAASAIVLTLSGCAVSSNVDTRYATKTGGTVPLVKKDVNTIDVTTYDVTERSYDILGDITVMVRKMTEFDANPTNADVDNELRKKAAQLGADAVILVRYGRVGMTPLSYGALQGKGRAIKFK